MGYDPNKGIFGNLIQLYLNQRDTDIRAAESKRDLEAADRENREAVEQEVTDNFLDIIETQQEITDLYLDFIIGG